jgi:hypothetical protein
MLIEMGLIQKLRLLVGHPGYTLAVVLASIVLFAGIGSFASGRLFSSGVLTLGRGAVLTAAATVACILVFDALAPAILALPQVVKMLLAFLLPAVPAFFMGQLFPQGLARLPGFDGEVSLQMAVNAVAGTIASGLAVSLAQLVGYNAMILCGVALYLIAGVAAGRAREMAV